MIAPELVQLILEGVRSTSISIKTLHPFNQLTSKISKLISADNAQSYSGSLRSALQAFGTFAI